MVPTDWEKIWSLEEREKMAYQDRIQFENALLDIMHVKFEQNSDELPQRYFASNVTEFTKDGLRINLNFSDPILISQGQEADVIVIKLLKSYFLNPNPSLITVRHTRRNLATINEDEEYFIVRENIPRQLASQGDLQTLQASADAASGAL